MIRLGVCIFLHEREKGNTLEGLCYKIKLYYGQKTSQTGCVTILFQTERIVNYIP